LWLDHVKSIKQISTNSNRLTPDKRPYGIGSTSNSNINSNIHFFKYLQAEYVHLSNWLKEKPNTRRWPRTTGIVGKYHVNTEPVDRHRLMHYAVLFRRWRYSPMTRSRKMTKSTRHTQSGVQIVANHRRVEAIWKYSLPKISTVMTIPR